jgi:hypothetical protein
MSESTLTPFDPTAEGFTKWLKSPGFRTPRATVLHHTWGPTAAEFKGRSTIVAIRRYHVEVRGFSDIAANAYACPDGKVTTGRPLDRENWAHALISRARPEAEALALAGGDKQWFNSYGFGLETVANFDAEDPFGQGPAGRSFQCALNVLTVVHRTFNLPANRLFFHRDVADKSCPGAKLDRTVVRNLLAERLAAPEETKVVLDGRVVNCAPELVGGEVTFEAAPVLAALGIPVNQVPAWVIHENGRCFAAELQPFCPGWRFEFRRRVQGPRLYVNRTA